MQISSYTKIFSAALCFLLFTSCGNNNSKSTSTETTKGAADNSGATQASSTTNTTATKAEDGPAIATIETDLYVAKIHRAIPVVIKQDASTALYKVRDGYQYIVLDMSVKNKSGKELDMGQIMLGAKVTDESGKDVGNLMAIAAYAYANPGGDHQTQYEAMWGKMQPGDFNRTYVLGMEAPKTAKTFKLSMKTTPDFFDDKSRKEVTFTL